MQRREKFVNIKIKLKEFFKMWSCSIQSSGLSFLILGNVFVCGKQPGAGSKRAVSSDGTSELHFPGYVPALQLN